MRKEKIDQDIENKKWEIKYQGQTEE